MASKVYVGTIGTILDIDTLIASGTLSTASAVAIKVKKPDNSVDTWPATQVNETSLLRHIFVGGDLSVKGKYKIQAAVTLNGHEILGETVILPVYEAFD